MIEEKGLRRTCPNQRSAAFTFVELLWVIVIVAILAAIAFSLWPESYFDLNAQSKLLVSNMRYIRNYAMIHDGRYRVNFDRHHRQISLSDDAGRCIHDPATGQCGFTLAEGIRLMTLGVPNGYIAFDRYGTPYLSSNQRLRRSATVILMSKDHFRTISIIPETGALMLSS